MFNWNTLVHAVKIQAKQPADVKHINQCHSYYNYVLP